MYVIRISTFIMFLTGFVCTLFAQEEDMETFKQSLSHTEDKEFVLDEIFQFLKNKEGVKNDLYFALEESIAAKDSLHQARFLILLSTETFKENDINASLAFAYEALGIVEQLKNDYELLVWVHLRLSLALKEMGAFAETIEHRKAQKLYLEKQKKFSKAANINNQIGKLYLRIGDYDTALVYFQKYLEFELTHNNPEGVAFSHNNIGFTYLEKGDYKLAQEFFEKSKLFYLYSSSTKGRIMLTVVQNNLAYCLINLGKYQKALEFANDALRSAKEIENWLNATRSSILHARIYHKKGDLNRANLYLDSAFMYFNMQRSRKDKHIEELLKIYNLKSDLLKDMRDYGQALHYKNLYLEQYEVLYGRKKMDEMLLSRSHFQSLDVKNKMKLKRVETERQAEQIALLEKENALQGLRLFSVVLIALLGLIVALYFVLRYKRKHEVEKLQKDLLKATAENQSERLTETSITLARKKDFAEDLKKKIGELEGLAPNERSSIKLFLENELQMDSSLLEMEKLVSELGEEFFAKLKRQHTELTKNDLKLCGLIRLKLTTKQISIVKSITPQSVKVSKNRLSKKMGLEKGTILYDYLKSI